MHKEQNKAHRKKWCLVVALGTIFLEKTSTQQHHGTAQCQTIQEI